MKSWLQPEPVQAYERIAPVYDHLMKHVRYGKWARYIHHIFSEFGNGGCRVLDAGCGTGKMMQALRKYGFHTAGFDRSYHMLCQAQSAATMGIWQGDLTVLAVHPGWDGIVCLYDTVHYLDLLEFEALCGEAAHILKPGGLFVFDVVTERHIRDYWADFMEIDQYAETKIVRRSWYDPGKRCQYTEFEIRDPVTRRTYMESHRQWIYSLADIEARIAASVLERVGCFDGYTFDAGNEKSERIHYVLRKVQL